MDKIKIIKSQTDYDDETAKSKLERWKGDHLNVIREYLNPKFNEPKKEKIIPVNQKIMSEIRIFMDDINRGAFKKNNEKFDKEYLND